MTMIKMPSMSIMIVIGAVVALVVIVGGVLLAGQLNNKYQWWTPRFSQTLGLVTDREALDQASGQHKQIMPSAPVLPFVQQCHPDDRECQICMMECNDRYDAADAQSCFAECNHPPASKDMRYASANVRAPPVFAPYANMQAQMQL